MPNALSHHSTSSECCSNLYDGEVRVQTFTSFDEILMNGEHRVHHGSMLPKPQPYTGLQHAFTCHPLYSRPLLVDKARDEVLHVHRLVLRGQVAGLEHNSVREVLGVLEVARHFRRAVARVHPPKLALRLAEIIAAAPFQRTTAEPGVGIVTRKATRQAAHRQTAKKQHSAKKTTTLALGTRTEATPPRRPS